MNQSVRAAKPTKKFNLSHLVDCVAFDSKNQQIILTDFNDLLYYDQDTFEFRQYSRLEKIKLLLDFKFQSFTNNLLLKNSDHLIHILSDEKKPLAVIETNLQKNHVWTRGLCCLPNSDFCVVAGFYHALKMFDSGGRFLSEFRLNRSPEDICYLDRWNAPSSSASSLMLVIECEPRLSVWDVNHIQHI